jgi:hypothetical protein
MERDSIKHPGAKKSCIRKADQRAEQQRVRDESYRDRKVAEIKEQEALYVKFRELIDHRASRLKKKREARSAAKRMSLTYTNDKLLRWTLRRALASEKEPRRMSSIESKGKAFDYFSSDDSSDYGVSDSDNEEFQKIQYTDFQRDEIQRFYCEDFPSEFIEQKGALDERNLVPIMRAQVCPRWLYIDPASRWKGIRWRYRKHQQPPDDFNITSYEDRLENWRNFDPDARSPENETERMKKEDYPEQERAFGERFAEGHFPTCGWLVSPTVSNICYCLPDPRHILYCHPNGHKYYSEYDTRNIMNSDSDDGSDDFECGNAVVPTTY